MRAFADCVIDVDGRVLLRAGVPQHLEPQAFDVLAHLLAHRDRVVPKEELFEVVWGGRWISDSALTTRVKEVRRATGDDGAEQAVVRTVRGRGYQFVAALAEPAPPRAARPLLGRARDLAEILDRLGPGSLVTLVGAGGVGKSSLAREVVARAASQFPHGAVVVDLSVLASSAALLSAVARAAQLVHDEQPDLVESLARLDALVVLDDADDLVPQVAQLCDRLAGSRVALLVTCRERLGSRGEQLWPVLALSAGAARELLLDRARSLAPLAGLADLDAERLDALTASVDRLPLALEMLAAMASLMGVDELREVVERRLDLVTTVHRDAPERHRSLDALVASSLDRLDTRARDALLAVSAFAGAFTVSDAAAVLEVADGLAVVRQLVDRSLLSPVAGPGAPRYQVLRTVRVALSARVAAASLLATARRHAEYVVAALETADRGLRGRDEPRAAATFDRLADEARAAHSWARRHQPDLAVRLTAALDLYCYSRLWAEPAVWAGELVGRDGSAAPAVLVALAAQAVQEGRLDDGRRLADEVLRAGDAPAAARALEVLSDLELYVGRTDDARRRAHELIEVGLRTNDPRPVAIGRVNEVFAVAYSGRPEEALALLGRDLPGALSPAPSERAWLACARGEVLALLGDPGAGAAFVAAIELGDEVGNLFVSGVARGGLASDQARRAAPRAAAATFLQVVESFLRHGNVTQLTVFLRNAVPVLATLEETAAAAVVAGWVLGPRARAGYGADVAAVRHTLVALIEVDGSDLVAERAAVGRGLSAVEVAERAIEALRRHVDPPA